MFFPELENQLNLLQDISIPEDRKLILQNIIQYIQNKKEEGRQIQLHFICTHNSRRSLMSQIWAQALADRMGLNLKAFSGGTEATSFHRKAIDTLIQMGFRITDSLTGINPEIEVQYGDNHSILVYSKKIDDISNPQDNFLALMTCEQADDTCPFIEGADKRLALKYEDPKMYDDSPQADQHYMRIGLQIASELHYVFSNIQ